jgi:capsular exopolysaccharide synthesis family protein
VAALLENYSVRYEQSPDIQRELLTIERECQIKSGLYVMLLQKYEENALSLAIASNNLRCIDSPIVVGQVAPNSKMIFLVALVVGLVIPVLIIYLIESMRTTLSINDDVAALTAVPTVGRIPLKKSASSIVVARNTNDIMAEAFRSIRTNLQFVMKGSGGKIVMFTSTTSGEGKTFVASNLAASVAILGKKVLLVGLDIRRPRLAEMFGFDKEAEGITSYLAADAENTSMLDGLIVPSGVEDNLFVLPAGIVPPNPAELLSRHNLDVAMEYLSSKFDYIVLDTAPVALVTDSMIISRVADAVAYVARYDYTQKADLRYLNTLIADGKLSNVSLVLNGDDLAKKTHGYVSERRSVNKYLGYGYYNDGEKK